MPSKWLEELRPYDQVWAPSAWGRDVLLAHGVPPGRVRVLESGFNARIFQPGPDAVRADFVFLCVGKYEKRKSIDEAIQAFEQEFPADRYPDVKLWLKADFPLFPERAQQLASRLAHDIRIRVVSGDLSDEQMAQLYRRADAFVFASKAEGFGLPLLEAIACGVPVIATRVSAQTVFLDAIPGLFAPIDYKLAPIDDPDYRHFYGADYGGSDFGNWALPSIPSIRQAMRELFERPAHWRALARQASTLVRARFCWDAVACRALDTVQELASPGAAAVVPGLALPAGAMQAARSAPAPDLNQTQ